MKLGLVPLADHEHRPGHDAYEPQHDFSEEPFRSRAPMQTQDHEVGFLEINPVTKRLLELVGAGTGLTGRQVLEQIAAGTIPTLTALESRFDARDALTHQADLRSQPSIQHALASYDHLLPAHGHSLEVH